MILSSFTFYSDNELVDIADKLSYTCDRVAPASPQSSELRIIDQDKMSGEPPASWSNGDGGGKESEGALDSYCQPPDQENSSEPSRKRLRSSSSDSNQSSGESSLTSQSQKKMKIVVRTIRAILLPIILILKSFLFGFDKSQNNYNYS